MGKLDGKLAVITGAGGGIGSATARLFAREGASVVLADVALELAEAVAHEIKDGGCEARAVACDVADEASVQAALADVGRLDVLVNNAGVTVGRPLVETSVQEWDRVMAVNLRGTFLMTKHAAPRMGRDGAIVNIASVAALMAVTGAGAYAAAKGGIVSLTRVAAAELGPDIRVNCICPGTVHTGMPEEMFRARGDGDIAAGVALTKKKYLLGRLGLPTEIASTALFLAGPDSAFFTGAVLVADGGVTAQ
jgi:NAD(P)-dependent dehydrogenase (short-subunit alcohol dehydrogenase family)